MKEEKFFQALETSAEAVNKGKTAEAPKKAITKKEEKVVKTDYSKFFKDADAEFIKDIKDFIEEHKLYITKDNNKYLLVEAWQYIFHKLGVHPTIATDEEVYRVEDKNDVNDGYIRYRVRAELIDDQTGEILSSCFMECDNKGTLGILSKEWAVASFAQTRAIAKLGRQMFGWLPISIGCKATPAEEMGLEIKG